LSYRPGEETCKRYGFHYFNVRLTKEWRAKGKTLEDCRIAAAKSLYKWYRVTAIDPVTQKDLKVEGLDQFKDVDGNKIEVFDGEQIVPLPVVLGSDRDEERKFYIDAPRVYGVRTDNLYTVQSSADTRYTLPFSIDSDRRLVIFDQTMVRDNVFNQVVNRFVKAGIGFAPLPRVLEAAELVLVTSIHVLEPVTRQPVRYQRDRKIPNGSPGTIQTVRREDVQFINFVDYTPGTWKARKVKDNRKECDKAADHYLDGFDRFEDVKTDQRTYPRLIPQLLDGAIQRVTWRCGGGVFTTIARNAERVPWIQPYEFRRGQERLFHQIAENVERVFGIPVGVQLPALPPPT
jgi:hypothetical protein